jgi:NitT/TauT family transport system substrate-binding protein
LIDVFFIRSYFSCIKIGIRTDDRITCKGKEYSSDTVFNTELKKLTGQTIPEDVLTEALTRLEFTNDPIKLSLFQSANDAYDLGFLAKGQERPNLSGIYDLALIDQVLSEKGLPTIEDTGGQILSSNNTGQSQGLTDVA